MGKDGGYDAGYLASSCFWGRTPGSLVTRLLGKLPRRGALRALDLGCGEGKNAFALAEHGHRVDAVDCSLAAIRNGKSVFNHPLITWQIADVTEYEPKNSPYDVLIAYGLMHCLPSVAVVREVFFLMKSVSAPNAFHVMCAFNDRHHDLSAHPGFSPLLLPHKFYVDLYKDWDVIFESDTDLHEVHPHNGIPHQHSMTRIIAKLP